MSVLFFSPGFPAEMPLFVRGLAEIGVRVIGLGDQPAGALPEPVRARLSGYIRLDNLWDEEAAVRRVAGEARRYGIERVECLWEPGVLLAARLREALGLPGMTREQTVPFRDKTVMKRILQKAGLRTPHHARATTAGECREAAEKIGYPLIVKPVAGAGSADTYRLDGPDDLERVLPRIAHVPEVSVEEFIDGEEFTFDTVCHDGVIAFHNISWYRPRPLVARTLQWTSPQTVALRDVEAPHLAAGAELGRKVLAALGFRTGFTHMEWFRKEDGEAVFGEIAARPPGARSTDLMNFACDIDLFRGWAEAVCHRRFTQPVRRLYNVAIIFKRAEGEGRIRAITGLESLLARYGRAVVSVDLLPVGALRRDWKQTLLSDGWLVVRHPDLGRTLEIADAVGTDLRLFAG
ncbi:MAG: ATP-grasp domain-containing protein [Thermoanaerobaculia bacterium]|nr:ATP-grasp domain-containing protein [Thermoanaerobaculia bacterium]